MDQLTMHWVFDDPERFITMSRCQHTVYGPDLHNNDGRFNVSNIHWYWRNARQWYDRNDCQWQAHAVSRRPHRYVYPIGCFSSPAWWSGWPNNAWDLPSMFDLIPPEVLHDARSARCMIMIDNLNEGFHLPQLWQFMHAECTRLAIPPRCIVYLSSNLHDQKAYQQWCLATGETAGIHVVNFCHLMYQQRIAMQSYPQPCLSGHVEYKTAHAASIKLYNCLNRRSYLHREQLLLRLLDANLLRHGLVSHDTLHGDHSASEFSASTVARAAAVLPLVVDDGDFSNNKAMSCNPNIYLSSWLSVITETHATDDACQLFISEKIWKPIYCLHPFMVLGNPGTMRALTDMGYRVDFCDWTQWDDASVTVRMQAIVANLKSLCSVSDKLSWFLRAQEHCAHNYQLFMRQDFFSSAAADQILRIYNAMSNH
jgi:hypothetical protein